MTATHDTTTTTTKIRRGYDLYAAPGRDPSILAAPPHVSLSKDGKHMLALVSLDGTIDGEDIAEVESMTNLPIHDLVFVRTRTMGIVMNGSDYHAHLPEPTDDEFHARDVRTWAESAVYGLMHHIHRVGLEEMPDRMWHIAGDLMQGDAFEQRFAYLLC